MRSRNFRAVFFMAKWWDGHKIDNMIDVWTLLMNLPRVIWQTRCNFKEIKKFCKMKFAHVEIWLPYDGQYQPRQCDWMNGLMWTSTMRDDDNGTVFRKATEVLKDRSRWMYWEFLVPATHHLENARCYAMNEVLYNKGYGKRDIAKFFPGIRHIVPNDETRNICSEFSVWFMVIAKTIFTKFKMMSPRLMAWEIYRATDELPVAVQEKKHERKDDREAG